MIELLDGAHIEHPQARSSPARAPWENMPVRVATLGLCLLLAAPASARVTRFEVLDQTPFAGGASFGPAGPYVIVRAIAHGELDPGSPANATIALLQQAPRNARGMVEYDTDVEILRPDDPARGSHLMLYDVLNRGNKYVPSWIDDAPEPPAGMVNHLNAPGAAGNGFVLRHGWTIVWSGWQPDAPAANHGMRIRVPVATQGGVPVIMTIRHEFVAGTRGPEGVRIIPLPYPTADMTARLTVRARQEDPPTEIPPGGWRWIDARSIQLMPFGTVPVPRHIYELTYSATAPTVGGIGFAAVRDVVAHLRREDGIQHTIGFGVSLSGRFLRHFLDLGMNRDEDGGRVFDGMLPHIAGAGKVFGNQPFAMPGRTATQHEDRFYPEVWQPVGYPGLLRDPATDPLIYESNTSTEYWQKGASLVHGEAPLPPTVRMLLVAGTQHGGHAGTPGSPGPCANPRNPSSAGPALRAMLVNLEAWVVHGTAPPDSLVPRAADETGVPAAAVHMPKVPGVTWAPRDNRIGEPVDWITPPPAPLHEAPTLVAAVDADGNERAGLRLPHVAVPLGTTTGVNVYRDLPDQLCDRDGIAIPFARTRAERMATGDPRPSLEERYAGREDYVAKVAAAAAALVAARLLLPEDGDRYAAAARLAPGFQ